MNIVESGNGGTAIGTGTCTGIGRGIGTGTGTGTAKLGPVITSGVVWLPKPCGSTLGGSETPGPGSSLFGLSGLLATKGKLLELH